MLRFLGKRSLIFGLLLLTTNGVLATTDWPCADFVCPEGFRPVYSHITNSCICR